MSDHEPAGDGLRDFLAFAFDILVAAVAVVVICTTIVRCAR
jgi:hypothetical protein